MSPQRLKLEGHLALRLGLPFAGVHAADGLRLVAVLRAHLQLMPRVDISFSEPMKEESDSKINREPASKSLQCLSVVDLATGVFSPAQISRLTSSHTRKQDLSSRQ